MAQRTAAKFCTQTRVPFVCNMWAGSYVDRGRRWEEIKIWKHCAYTCCCESHAAASFDFGRVAGVRRTPATSSKSDTPSWDIHTAAPGHSETGRSNRMACDRGRNGRDNARHPDRGAQRREKILKKLLSACVYYKATTVDFIVIKFFTNC